MNDELAVDIDSAENEIFSAPVTLKEEAIKAIRKAHFSLLAFIVVAGILIPFSHPLIHLSGALLISAVLWRVVKNSKRDLFRSPPFSAVGYSVLMELGTLFALICFVLFLTASLTSWLGPFKMARSLAEWQKSGAANDPLSMLPQTWATFFTVAVLVPFYEECFFRGYLLDVYRNLGDKFAVIFSSLIFCALHQPLFNSLFTFLAGLVFAVLTVRYNSILPSFLIHMLGNFLAFSMPLLAGSSEASGRGEVRLEDMLNLSQSIEALQPVLSIITALLTLLCCYLIYRLIRRLWRQKGPDNLLPLTINDAARVFFHWPVLGVMVFFMVGLIGWFSSWIQIFLK